MASKCQKFVPNIFYKSKCQHCFAAKEAHSAEALENNKASRKVSKCGYLFVSPGFDFNNPLDRTKRWQRRFFILYDDGELTYSVDENPDTVPQSTVDMNKCTDVLDAEKTTTHSNSLAISTPEQTMYIKGNSREEIQWWHDILVEFPKALKATKPRKKMPYLIMSNKENMQPDDSVNGSTKNGEGDSKQLYVTKPRIDGSAFVTFRGVRSLKHKYDANHQEGMRKSSSLHDLSTQDKEMNDHRLQQSSRFLSRSGDELDSLSRDENGIATFTLTGPAGRSASLPSNTICSIPRSTWTRTGQPIPSSFAATGKTSTNKPSSSNHPTSSNTNTLSPIASQSQFHSSSSISSNSSSNSAMNSSNSQSQRRRRGSVDDQLKSTTDRSGSSSGATGRLRRERSSSLKDFPTQFSLARNSGKGDDLSHQQPVAIDKDQTDSNQTDELKDLAYMKKGWLIKQAANDKESRKHWFVLTGNSLRYYKDAKAEDCNALDGRIDLSTCYEVSETNTHRNYGFRIKTRNGEYVLAAMTSGIRSNWMKAIRLFMEIHNSPSKRRHGNSQSTLPVRSGSKIALTQPRTLDDFDLKSRNSSISTAAVKGAGGETAFQLVGRKDPYKREIQKPSRRHHSDVNPGNVSSVFTVKEFSMSNLDPSIDDPFAVSGNSSRSSDSQRSSSQSSSGTGSSPARIETMQAQSCSQLLSKMNRFVEGSDSLPVTVSSNSRVGGGSNSSGSNEQLGVPLTKHRAAITSESPKEEVKRAMMKRAKSPSARVREKTRSSSKGSITPRLTSTGMEYIQDGSSYRLSPSPSLTPRGCAIDVVDGSTLTDLSMSEDEYLQVGDDTDHEEVASATTTSDIVAGKDALVDILEKEVETLQVRLDQTQTELEKVHKDNMDLKNRIQKDSTQSVDSGYTTSSSRYSSPTTTNQPEILKRQLKEARDTVQRQRLDIDSLKGKLDMSVSKLTGTEKALSEALRDYKQEKDKFLKLSTEWNRRIRTLETNNKDNMHKLERSQENLQAKERECRRLEVEMKSNLQKSREQEKEVLKLKAVEHEYNQLKEKLDDRDHDYAALRSEMKEKERVVAKMKEEHQRHLEDVEREFGQEHDDLEHHIEQLKTELYNSRDRQTSMTDNMTSDMAEMCSEKDHIIAQLEEKMIDAEKKLEEMSDEFQAEMGENADLAHRIELLQEEKLKMASTIDSLEGQLMAFQSKVAGFQKDNFSLRKQLQELQLENTQLHQSLERRTEEEEASCEQETLKQTIKEMNVRIVDLQNKLMHAETLLENRHSDGNTSSSSSRAVSSSSSQHSNQDLFHTVHIIDTQLQGVNSSLVKLHTDFDTYLNTLPINNRMQVINLANQAEDVNHYCQQIRDSIFQTSNSLTLNSLEDNKSMYQHQIKVDSNSGKKVILEEYHGLKSKFDHVTFEVKKVKKELESMKSLFEATNKENSKLREELGVLQKVLKPQLVGLINHVNDLSNKILDDKKSSSNKASPISSELTASDSVHGIANQLKQLECKIEQCEKNIVNAGNNFVNGEGNKINPSLLLAPVEQEGTLLKLHEVKQQLEVVKSKLDSLNPLPDDAKDLSEACALQAGEMKEKIKSLTMLVQSLANAKRAEAMSQGKNNLNEMTDSSLAAEGLSNCLSVIKERVQGIGELLDSLEEDGEDSDSEDEDGGVEQSGVEEVREKLASLTEYIEQHSRMTTSEWAILQLLDIQKSHLASNKDTIDNDCGKEEEKLKLYSDRLSLESVILSEMATLIQEEDILSPEDPVSKEIDVLNSQLLLLHYQLDNETKTMHFNLPQADLMESYTQLMAEKILVNGHLYANSLEDSADTNQDGSFETTSNPPSVQPVILATEALVRSQIDSYISENLDRSSSEILTLPTHLTTRALIQGDLSYALGHLKSRLASKPNVLQAGPSNYEFMFSRLKERQRNVMASLKQYEEQLIKSLAVIIWKESEEMTIVNVPESVLDAMCSELSTIMEKHIQKYKELCRSTTSMHTASKFDIIVQEIRKSREATLIKIKQHYEAYSKDQSAIRDSSLDVPVQSFDDTINNFGEILSLKSVVSGTTAFLAELLKMGDTVLSDIDLDQDEMKTGEDMNGTLAKNLLGFVGSLSEALKTASSLRLEQSKKIINQPNTTSFSADDGIVTSSPSEISSHLSSSLNSLLLADLNFTEGLTRSDSTRQTLVIREAVFSAQLTFLMLKLKLMHEQDLSQTTMRRLPRSKPQGQEEESRDSDDTLELQTDVEALLMPLEEVLECKHADEVEVLQVLLSQVKQIRTDLGPVANSQPMVGEQLQLLEQKLHHEVEVAHQRHNTHLEVFKQEMVQLEKCVDEQHQYRDHFEERCLHLEEELSAMQTHHEQDKERMKQDILTAVHAIKSNDEKSETQLMEKASKLNKDLAQQKFSFRKILLSLRGEVQGKNKSSLCDLIDSQLAGLALTEEEEEVDDLPPLPEQPPPCLEGSSSSSALQQSLSASDVQGLSCLDMSHHEQEVEQLKKEKEEALAEEMRNTKAALDAMRKAYEDELLVEKSKYKDALISMYTEDYVNEIRMRHQEEEEHVREELKKLNLHYQSKCEDYKLLEIRQTQNKADMESHIEQLIKSNGHLEQMLNREIDSIKDFITNKPSLNSLTTGSATIEEELYDAKIMVRVKDAELQKLRAQVKTQENSLQRTMEEQRQTMTHYMQALKNSGEAKKQHQEEMQQLTEKLNKVLSSQGLKANIKRTPSFHQRARSPSPQPSASPRKDSDHSSRESNRRRHIQPKDLRRSKSSPSLPFVFDGKGPILAPKAPSSKLIGRRSRSPKT